MKWSVICDAKNASHFLRPFVNQPSLQANLKWENIDFRQEIIPVQHSKSGRKRYVPMNPLVVQTLRILPRRINASWVFCGNGDHRRMSPPKEGENYLVLAGIKNFRWHDFRHTFASRLVSAGVPLYTVQGLLGRSTIKMTERYSHLQPGKYRDAVRVLADQQPPKQPLEVLRGGETGERNGG